MQDKSCMPDGTLTGSEAALPTMGAIGSVLQVLRRARHMTQQELAIASQTNVTQVHRIEVGHGQDMSLMRFLRLCRALGVAPEQVLALALTPGEITLCGPAGKREGHPERGKE